MPAQKNLLLNFQEFSTSVDMVGGALKSFLIGITNTQKLANATNKFFPSLPLLKAYG